MSAKPVAQKLLIKPKSTVWASDRSRLDLIGPLPDGVKVEKTPDRATTALVFAEDAASLREILEANTGSLSSHESLWVAYPKANRADINRDTLWPILAEHGMRPIAQVALDDVWSALRFRPLRQGEKQFTGGR